MHNNGICKLCQAVCRKISGHGILRATLIKVNQYNSIETTGRGNLFEIKPRGSNMSRPSREISDHAGRNSVKLRPIGSLACCIENPERGGVVIVHFDRHFSPLRTALRQRSIPFPAVGVAVAERGFGRREDSAQNEECEARAQSAPPESVAFHARVPY